MSEYSVPRFHLAWTDAAGGSCTGDEKTSTGIQQELRTMRLAVDQLWVPFQYLAIWHEGRRVAIYLRSRKSRAQRAAYNGMRG